MGVRHGTLMAFAQPLHRGGVALCRPCAPHNVAARIFFVKMFLLPLNLVSAFCTPPNISNRCLYLNGRASKPGGLLIHGIVFSLFFSLGKWLFLGLLIHGRSAKNGRGVAYIWGLLIEGCLYLGGGYPLPLVHQPGISTNHPLVGSEGSVWGTGFFWFCFGEDFLFTATLSVWNQQHEILKICIFSKDCHLFPSPKFLRDLYCRVFLSSSLFFWGDLGFYGLSFWRG